MAEIYSNKPNLGIGPQDPYAFSSRTGEPSEKPSNSSFYKLSNRPETDPSQIHTLTDYQNFVNSDWKTQHGTYDSVNRFGEKLLEETDELYEAYESTAEDRDRELLSELGDVAFCAVALMSNSSADIDDGIKLRAYRYIRGVRDKDSNHPQEIPGWYPHTASIAIDPAPTTISDIDRLMDGLPPEVDFDLEFHSLPTLDFEPLLSPARNIYSDDPPDADVDQHLRHISLASKNLISAAQQQYRYGGDDEGLTHLKPYDYYRDNIGEMAAYLMLEIAYFAKVSLSKTLRNVIDKNVEKITGRVAANLVDKSDGNRSAELL
ncbi:hypothetical protein FWD07_01855 [Candidatus Saccharibacteria bacterium]|nr:hypothetical protein [Candidatus Saccharibacteria bacterium]